MAEYLADPDRVLFLAETGAMPVGYTMLVLTPPTDDDVLAALTLAPSVELSKCYVLAGQPGLRGGVGARGGDGAGRSRGRCGRRVARGEPTQRARERVL